MSAVPAPTRLAHAWLDALYSSPSPERAYSSQDMLDAFRAGFEHCDAHHYGRSSDAPSDAASVSPAEEVAALISKLLKVAPKAGLYFEIKAKAAP